MLLSLLLYSSILFMASVLQLDSKAELKLKEDNEDDYALNSECYLEVRIIGHGS